MHHLTVWRRQHWWFLRDRRKGSTRPRSLLILQPLQPAFQCWKIYSDLHLKQSVESFPNFPMPSNENPWCRTGKAQEESRSPEYGVVAGFVAFVARLEGSLDRAAFATAIERVRTFELPLVWPVQSSVQYLWLIVYDCILYDCVWLCMIVYDCREYYGFIYSYTYNYNIIYIYPLYPTYWLVWTLLSSSWNMFFKRATRWSQDTMFCGAIPSETAEPIGSMVLVY